MCVQGGPRWLPQEKRVTVGGPRLLVPEVTRPQRGPRELLKLLSSERPGMAGKRRRGWWGASHLSPHVVLCIIQAQQQQVAHDAAQNDKSREPKVHRGAEDQVCTEQRGAHGQNTRKKGGQQRGDEGRTPPHETGSVGDGQLGENANEGDEGPGGSRPKESGLRVRRREQGRQPHDGGVEDATQAAWKNWEEEEKGRGWEGLSDFEKEKRSGDRGTHTRTRAPMTNREQ